MITSTKIYNNIIICIKFINTGFIQIGFEFENFSYKIQKKKKRFTTVQSVFDSLTEFIIKGDVNRKMLRSAALDRNKKKKNIFEKSYSSKFVFFQNETNVPERTIFHLIIFRLIIFERIGSPVR